MLRRRQTSVWNWFAACGQDGDEDYFGDDYDDDDDEDDGGGGRGDGFLGEDYNVVCDNRGGEGFRSRLRLRRTHTALTRSITNPTQVRTILHIFLQNEANGNATATTPALVSHHCFRAHEMHAFRASHGWFTCDVCGKGMQLGSPLQGCRECNYDMCSACDSALARFFSAPLTSTTPRTAAAPVGSSSSAAATTPTPPPLPTKSMDRETLVLRLRARVVLPALRESLFAALKLSPHSTTRGGAMAAAAAGIGGVPLALHEHALLLQHVVAPRTKVFALCFAVCNKRTNRKSVWRWMPIELVRLVAGMLGKDECWRM